MRKEKRSCLLFSQSERATRVESRGKHSNRLESVDELQTD